jgi:predicted regulator of Ras-like GTPase activity (Roadblock/LC7/MglB family)
VAPRPEPAQPTIYATIWDLAENWPQELKDEIAHNALTNLSVPLAGSVVGPGMKRGRITMLWKDLRTLAKPSSMPSPNDGLELELPLKVVAPIFFAALKNAPVARKATTVSSDIPNLFFGFPQAAPTPPVPLTPPVPIVSASLPPVAPKPVENKTAESNSNFYVWGENGEVPKLEADYAAPPVPNTDFTSRRAMPKDVVAKAMTLRGMAGAVITLPDGLRVASEVPPEFNADTLAAFIPQMFERMNQSARELRMGSLNNVSFTVGNVPWRIIRVNAVYLAAFGRAGVSLPSAELTELAEELDRKKS